MIGHYIANTIMLSYRMTREDCEKQDIKNGFEQGFKDYDTLWDRRPFEIESDDAIIRGEVIHNPDNLGERKKVAIICHGLSAIRYADLKYGKMFYDRGYNLIIFDERYFGESTGKYCTLGWKETGDVAKIIEYARTVFGSDAFIGLHGESMGGATVCNVLSLDEPDFVIADCPFADAELLIKDLAWNKAFILGPAAGRVACKVGMKRYGYDYRVVKPVEAVAKSTVPICFMHGKEDTLINCKHSEMMYEKSKNPLSELHVFEGADHAQSVAVSPKGYEQIMMDFVRKIEIEKY